MHTRLSESVADSLRAAYYYALTDGHAAVDPGLLLMAAARNDSRVAAPVAGSSGRDLPRVLAAAGPVSGPWAADLREARAVDLGSRGPAAHEVRPARQPGVRRPGTGSRPNHVHRRGTSELLADPPPAVAQLLAALARGPAPSDRAQ